MKLKVTICIATFNGAKKIIKTLSAIIDNSLQADEIIVFIDGSSDNTVKIIREFDKENRITIIESVNLGRASARNKAAALASNDIILFLDDDILIPKNTIHDHLKKHAENPSLILSCPTITVQSSNDFSNFKRDVELRWNEYVKNNAKDDVSFSAAFFSINKKLFIDIGGFCDGLNDAEDYEFGLRLTKKGLSVVVNYDNFGIHNDPVTCKSFIQRNRQYMIANQILVDQKLIKDNKYLAPKPKIWKKIIFYFFSKKFLIYLIDNNLLTFLNKKIRFKIYNYVSAAFIYYFPEKDIN
jgi:GT2 family glycosyltransferase